jgi:hypothetical protein
MAMPKFGKMAADLDAHPKIRKAGRNGREVFLFVVRRNAALDRSGRVSIDHVEPWYLADQLMMPEAEAEQGLERAIKAGLLARVQNLISIVGWDDEWAKAPLSETERKRRQREKENDQPVTSGESRDVTKCHAPSVTNSDCLDSHASDQIRSEEIRSDQIIGVASAPTPNPLTLASEPPTKKARKKPAMAMPAAWSASANAIAKGVSLGLDVTREIERFRDYHDAKGSVFADWDAAFRTWLGNAQRFGVGRTIQRDRNNPTETSLESLREAREREGRTGPSDPFGDVPHAAEGAA